MLDTAALPAPTDGAPDLVPTAASAQGTAPASGTAGGCLDCGAPRLGAYCHGCGQHHADDRLTLRGVWRDFAERFLKFERGLPATARLAVLDPGRLAREYVGGRRRRYVNPVSFLLLGSAVAVLLLPIYGSAERVMNSPGMAGQNTEAQSEAGIDIGIRMTGGDPADLPAEERERLIAENVERQANILPEYLSTIG